MATEEENTGKILTVRVAAGDTYTTLLGARDLSFLYKGTVDAVTFTGNTVQRQASVPVSLPPNIPYNAPFNTKGYNPIFIDNTGGDTYVDVTMSF